MGLFLAFVLVAILKYNFWHFSTKMLIATFLNEMSLKKLTNGDAHQTKHLLLLSVPPNLLMFTDLVSQFLFYYSL